MCSSPAPRGRPFVAPAYGSPGLCASLGRSRMRRERGGLSTPGGGTVMRRLVIVGAVVAGNAIINTAASIDHDVRVELHAQVGPGCHLAGRVVVGEGAFLGTGAAVTPGRQIGAWATVGAGAVVIDDIAEGSKVGGVPARSLGQASG